MKSLIKISEFQERYGLSRSTVYRLIRSGEIGVVHIGRAVRIPSEDAHDWYARLCNSGNTK